MIRSLPTLTGKDTILLGIEGNTSLVGSGKQYEVLGSGGVNVWSRTGKTPYTVAHCPIGGKAERSRDVRPEVDFHATHAKECAARLRHALIAAQMTPRAVHHVSAYVQWAVAGGAATICRVTGSKLPWPGWRQSVRPAPVRPRWPLPTRQTN